MNDVVSIAQTNSGMRCIVMPGVRMFRIVTRKFSEPRMDELPRANTPTSHRLWANGPRALSGGYDVQPASAAPVANVCVGSGKKKTNVETMYRMPIFLWSVVVNQAPTPRRSRAASECPGAGELGRATTCGGTAVVAINLSL